ncbi:hypothetical protein CFOL_v3_22513 [Cephalotus follicularis]|uniref:Uncharacterized protein n=1 Tax=Cephalotus follicularis TaxID=3775 RepID=A0A1Q3CG08_CEPFO|nr:hypothetical protein CFOL_v3_22513 [Cephalotus follicularis]
MAEEETSMASTGEEGASNTSNSANWVDDLQRTLSKSKDSAILSARAFQHDSSAHLRSFRDFVPHAMSQFTTYEDAFFNTIKEELTRAKEHPAASIGVAVTASFLLLPGPRRFLIRHTFGRLQSEEAQFVKVENSVKELDLSVNLMKKESRKLLERAALAEKDMKRGHTELMDAGNQVQSLAKSLHKVETKASDLMDGLREIPGREALKLRAEVAGMTSLLKRQRTALDKRIMQISELGVPV